MAKQLTAEEKYELITRRLPEVLSGDILKKVLEERDCKGYWGACLSSFVSLHVNLLWCGHLRDRYNWETYV